MKKILFVLVMALMSLGAHAQSVENPGDKYPVYCTIKGYNTWGIGKMKVILDLGYKVTNYESIYGEDGKQVKFNTMMEAVNYMAKRGWELDKIFFLTESMSKTNVANYVLKKMVTSDEEIRKGLITQPEKD